MNPSLNLIIFFISSELTEGELIIPFLHDISVFENYITSFFYNASYKYSVIKVIISVNLKKINQPINSIGKKYIHSNIFLAAILILHLILYYRDLSINTDRLM